MGFFSGARYFSSHDGKRPEKIESKTFFFQQQQQNKTHRNARKKGAVRTSANNVAQLAVTSEKGVVNPVRSGSGSCNEISQKHQNRPNFIKLTCSARASRETSPFSDVRADISERLPGFSEEFYSNIFFFVFTHLCAFF